MRSISDSLSSATGRSTTAADGGPKNATVSAAFFRTSSSARSDADMPEVLLSAEVTTSRALLVRCSDCDNGENKQPSKNSLNKNHLGERKMLIFILILNMSYNARVDNSPELGISLAT